MTNEQLAQIRVRHKRSAHEGFDYWWARDLDALIAEVGRLRELLWEAREVIFRCYLDAGLGVAHEIDSEEMQVNDPEASLPECLACLKRLEAHIKTRKDVALTTWEKITEAMGSAR